MMNILMITDSLETGGAETHIELLAKELSTSGNTVTVASSGGKISQKLAKSGVKTAIIPQLINTKKAHKIPHFIYRFCLARNAVSRLVNQCKPDLIHAHTRRTAFLVHGICKMHKIPLVVTAHAKFSMKFPKNVISKWGDGTIAVSRDIKNHLIQHGVSQKQIKVIANGVSVPTPTQTAKFTENREKKDE